MRVLLISPNREVSPDPVYPLGLASLAAVLKAGGMTVKGSDLCFHPDWGKVLEQDLESFRPDCIGLSIRNIDNVTYPRSTAYLPFIKEVVDLCRRKTTAPIVVGGSGFTLLPEGVLDFLDADYGVVGEGERAFLDLLEKMAGDRLPRSSAGGSPPVPSRDRMVTGEPIKELNALPWPDRETFDAGAYREQGGLTNIQSKRGCPFHCIYCTYPLIEGRSVRVREPLGVVREIQALVDRGLDYIFFVDNNFNFPEEQAEGICREIIRQKVPVRWTAYVNPGFMTDRLGEAMKASGCAALEFGLDAAAPTQLDALGKNFSVLQIREAARICRERDTPFLLQSAVGRSRGDPGHPGGNAGPSSGPEPHGGDLYDRHPRLSGDAAGGNRQEGRAAARKLESPGAVFLPVPEGPGPSGKSSAEVFGGPSELDLPGLGDRPASRRSRQDASVRIERSLMGVLEAQEKKERRS